MAAYSPLDLDDICTKLETLVGQVEQLSQLARQVIAPRGQVGAPLSVYAALSGVGTNNDTDASTVNGRIRGAFLTTGSANETKVFMLHSSLPAGGVLLFHGYLNSNTSVVPLPMLEGQHVPLGAWFRVVTLTNSGQISLTVYVDPLPATAANVFATQRA